LIDWQSFFFAKSVKQGVALTGRNRTCPPCEVGRPTAHAPGRKARWPSTRRRPAGPTAGSVTDDDRQRRQTTTTDDSVQNNTGPLGGPVITLTHACSTIGGEVPIAIYYMIFLPFCPDNRLSHKCKNAERKMLQT